MTGDGFQARHDALLVHLQGDGGDFQQGIGLGIEAGGLDIDHDRQETTKSFT